MALLAPQDRLLLVPIEAPGLAAFLVDLAFADLKVHAWHGWKGGKGGGARLEAASLSPGCNPTGETQGEGEGRKEARLRSRETRGGRSRREEEEPGGGPSQGCRRRLRGGTRSWGEQ